MKEEIIIINNEPFYKIPNGTSCNYAPIPKEFKPYFEKLQEENKSLQSQLKEKEEVIEEAINYIDNNTYYKDHKGHINIDDLYIILQKGSDSNE